MATPRASADETNTASRGARSIPTDSPDEVDGERAERPGDGAQTEPGGCASPPDRLAEHVDGVANDAPDPTARTAIAFSGTGVQPSEDERRGKGHDHEQRTDHDSLEPSRRRDRLNADHEHHRERDHVAHAVESDGSERSPSRHGRLATEPPGAQKLADANGQHVVAREAADHHLVEPADAGPAACWRSFASATPAGSTRFRKRPPPGERARPPRLRGRPCTSAASASRIASQRKIALIATPPRATSARLRRHLHVQFEAVVRELVLVRDRQLARAVREEEALRTGSLEGRDSFVEREVAARLAVELTA